MSVRRPGDNSLGRHVMGDKREAWVGGGAATAESCLNGCGKLAAVDSSHFLARRDEWGRRAKESANRAARVPRQRWGAGSWELGAWSLERLATGRASDAVAVQQQEEEENEDGWAEGGGEQMAARPGPGD